MLKTAPKIELEVREKLNRLRGSARGLYHEMRYLIEHKSDGRPGELRENGAPMDVEQIALMAGYSAAKVPPLLDKLQAAGLLKIMGDGGILLPHIAKILEVRSRGADRVGRHRQKVLRNTQKGVTFDGCNSAVTKNLPPDGFPPDPSSLSPHVSLSARANGEAPPPVNASQIRSRATTATAETFREAKIDAVAAVSRWAAMNPPVGRGYPLDSLAAEDRQVFGFVEELAQEPLPIVRPGGSCSRHTLVANAVDMLIGARAQFKDLRWVFGCIRNKLKDWAQSGMDEGGARPAVPRLPPATPRVIKSQV